jgi:hypothetical protein
MLVVEPPETETIGQGIALCNASALFWRKLDLTSLSDLQELQHKL